MKNIAFWLKLSVFNFALVALLGVLMRYKIAFSLPVIDQKFAQEAHSHFAFYGWITQIIYVLVIRYLHRLSLQLNFRKYEALLTVNAVAAYAMIPSFLYKGYFWGSIAASTVALLSTFVFFFFLLKDLKAVKDHSKPWFLAGFSFAVLSSVGVFGLSYMMVSGNVSQNLYLAATYYYLHFQYNGFFLFACIGLLINSLKNAGSEITDRENKITFWLMFFGCVIGYGLSVLWLNLPIAVFILIVIATLAQTIGAVRIYEMVKRNWVYLVQNFSAMQRFVLMYVGFAFFVKILLQLGSNIPAVSQFAFGFRNIVIAYLHLILLMCISVFLISQVLATNVFNITKSVLTGLKLLLLGIFLNEAVLGLMGIFSIKYIAVPYAPEVLLAISVLMLAALLMIYFSLTKREM